MPRRTLRSNTKVTRTKLNLETGVYEERVEKTYYKKEKVEKTFVKTYDNFLEKLCELTLSKSGVLATYMTFSYFMNYENSLIIDKTTREEILKKLEITKKSLENHITELIKLDLVRRVSRGRYMVNPFYLAKGVEKDIRILEEKYSSLGKTA